MKRIPPDFLRQIRNDVDLAHLIEDLGIPSKRRGQQLVFRCPDCGTSCAATSGSVSEPVGSTSCPSSPAGASPAALGGSAIAPGLATEELIEGGGISGGGGVSGVGATDATSTPALSLCSVI